jgi:regulator of protease activity HflC (stomatin/prohibitin superfamily)
MKTTFKIVTVLLLVVLFTNCRTIRQGDVGVKRTLGKIDSKPLQPGPRAFNPFVSTIILVPVRTVNLEVNLALPSKEGLNVAAEISILFHVEPTKATKVIAEIGKDYQESVILPVFRAAAADVTAKYMAKDMHTGNRAEIENEIRSRMMGILEERGFVIEAVLLKSIKLPEGLYRAIEEKLEAEQQAQRMEFVIQQERQEAERRKIEAAGIRDANKIISEGLTPQILQYKAIEAYRELSNSNNAKVIIGGGTESMIINPQ